MKANVLVVEDDDAMGTLTLKGLTREGYAALLTRTAADALALLETEPVDVVLTDLNMPGMSGLELCQRLKQDRPDLPVIVITAFGSLETAIAAIRAGAYDFVTKPIQEGALLLTVDRAAQHRHLREELKRLRSEVASTRPSPGFLGDSPAFQKAVSLITRLANSESTVLITGETGTGKEVAAQKIHESSPRSGGPFIAVNCAAMPEHLLESELFGHAKGAFTDARTARTGLFAQASGGTLFLDEIGELPLALQPKLLRALQERKVRPLGSNAEVPFDARLIAATNRDLEAEIEAGRFREDLFFRINVIAIDLPPLRLRGNDVLLLAQKFVETFAAPSHKQVSGLSVEAAKKLLAYAWPGNVRELQNCIERAVTFATLEQLTVGDLPEKISGYQPTATAIDPSEIVTLEENERRYVARVVAAVGGNKSQAARLLGIDRKSLWRRLSRGEEPDAPAT